MHICHVSRPLLPDPEPRSVSRVRDAGGYANTSWYLDNLNVRWDAVYANEPREGVPDALCSMILGGQGEMWGETVDASDLQQAVWPRLGAIAEKLWSRRAMRAAAPTRSRVCRASGARSAAWHRGGAREFSSPARRLKARAAA